MDFGTYFRTLLEERGIGLARLADDIGIKSKNEIYRLLNNEYSYEKAARLTKKIVSAVDFTDAETKRLKELMQSLRVKASTRRAMEILAGIYRHDDIESNAKIRQLENMLNKFSPSDIQIFIGAPIDVNTVRFLDKYISERGEIKVEHRLDFNKPDDVLAQELFALVTLSKYRSYKCYECPRTGFSELVVLAQSRNNHYIAVETNGKYVGSRISGDFYEYMRDIYSPPCRNSIKRYQMSFSDYEDMVRRYSVSEQNDGFFFGGLFGFMDIPFKTLIKMLEDANYFGMSKDCEYVTSLVDAIKTRCASIAQSRSSKKVVMDREGMRNFFRTGVTYDHFHYFRPLRRSEIREMLDSMKRRQCRYECRFPVEGMELSPDIQCLLIENYGIVIFNPRRGYGEGHFDALLTNKRLVRLYREFTEYFWDNYTVSEKESLAELEKMVKRFF